MFQVLYNILYYIIIINHFILNVSQINKLHIVFLIIFIVNNHINIYLCLNNYKECHYQL